MCASREHLPGDGGDAASPGDARLPGSAAAGPPTDRLQLISFGLGREWYALETRHVRAIEPETAITPVPLAPAWLAGVFNLRGNVLPAVDPRPLLGIPPDTRGGGLLMVFEWGGHPAAFRVDVVDEIYEIPTSSLEPQLSTMDASRQQLLLGQVRVRDRLIGVLDLAALMRPLVEE